MAIRPVCDRCGLELTEFGALLFSPPSPDNEVHKYHICVDCYVIITKEFEEK